MKPVGTGWWWLTRVASAAMILLLAGCAEVRYTAPEPVPVELLPSYKQDNAEIKARIQIVDFVINSVDARTPIAARSAFDAIKG